MKVFETLDRDPRRVALANNGQARIAPKDERALLELRAELETFVCDGQYGEAIEKILSHYLKQLDRPRQDAAWVSGFFGSGKSHLLKMVGHLWVNTPFQDGSTARSLVRGLSDEIVAHLRELDVRVSRSGKPAFAAAASLLSGNREHVRATVLAIVLRACELPEHYPYAQFCFWLREQGHLEAVKKAVEDAGKVWLKELNNLYASPVIARAVLKCDPNFAPNEKEARAAFHARFPQRTTDLTTAEMLAAMRDALAPDGVMPLTILVVDEVQQYIGEGGDCAAMVTEVAEALQTQLDSRVMLVASGQSALSGTSQLQKLRDRFRITIQLSDADVEAVTRQVLLHKKPSAESVVRAVLDRNAGEVSKQLQGTRLAERAEDRSTIVEDYPLLPTRRRLFEEVFRSVDRAGTHSRLRSQLRILHDALTELAEREVGAVIPVDALYSAIASDLNASGAMSNEIEERIRALDDGTPEGNLRHRACGLVFLIGKLENQGAQDLGVRATAKTVADLLVDDLEKDSGPLRRQVELELESLVASGKLMKVGEQFRIQTAEGAEWDRAFRERGHALRQQHGELEIKRDQLLAALVQKTLSEFRLKHGESKTSRTLTLHARTDAPPAGGDEVIVWLRDGFSANGKDVESEARRRGSEDPVVHVFLPRKSADDLRSKIADAEAARAVIDSKGSPAQDAGREARDSMKSRLESLEAERDTIVREIVAAAHVYQGGGNEVFGESLRQKLEVAAEASLARLFPRFAEGDHKDKAWEVALKRAREGSDHPLVPVGWDKSIEEHPVARQVLTEIGNAARGTDVRRKLEAPPYGWPRDAIDTLLTALHRAGTLRVMLNGQSVAPGQLDQSKIQSAEFRPEKVRLGVPEKLVLRSLYPKAGVNVKSGEEEAKAASFLDAVRALANAAGGDAPLPARPSTAKIDELARLSGSEQLGAIVSAKDELERSIDAWTKLGTRAKDRVPAWGVLDRLCVHAAALPVAAEVKPETDAIRTNRSLLSDTDHVAPLIKKVGQALRAAVTQHADAYREAHAAGMSTLEADASWRQTSAAVRTEILQQVNLAAPSKPSIQSDDDLLRELDRQPLDARGSHVAAVAERVARALAEAARRLKPQAKRMSVRAATLSSEDEVRAWLAEHEARFLDAVKSGPVTVG